MITINKNILITIFITLTVSASLGFFLGTKYQQSKTPEFFRNMPSDFRQTRGQFPPRADRENINTVRGEIIGRDDTTVTVKLPDDSSKIIILTDSTKINKSETGSAEDLSEGAQVTISGQANSDGSLTAQNILVNPS